MADTFYRRFPEAPQLGWIRRGLFTTGYRRVSMLELATGFHSREQALAFAAEQKLGEVELVRLSVEPAA